MGLKKHDLLLMLLLLGAWIAGDALPARGAAAAQPAAGAGQKVLPLAHRYRQQLQH
jgi:hypothetical protein